MNKILKNKKKIIKARGIDVIKPIVRKNKTSNQFNLGCSGKESVPVIIGTD